jgi:hypothetical protein
MLEAIPLQVNRTRLLCILRLVLDLVYLLVRVQVSGGNQPGARPERNVGNAVVCSRVRELQKAAAIIALEISRRQFPRRGPPKALGSAARRLDLIHHQRGADMADLPGAPAGC